MQVRLEEIFKDVSNKNYELKRNSVAIDHGMALDAVSQDLLGTQRPQGQGYDIGAYEYK